MEPETQDPQPRVLRDAATATTPRAERMLAAGVLHGIFAGMTSALPPGSWKKVLVPTDFSDCARMALETAAAWHRDTGGAVVLLHVCEPGYEGLRVQTSGLHQQMEQAARDELAQAQRVHFPHAENVRALVVPGRPAETICRVAAEEDVDAIVIPTHGHSGLARALLGSVAEKVVRHAPCSVLIVRE